MMDVIELKRRLREIIIMNEVGSNNPLGREAADALETLAGEVERLRETINGYEVNERQLEGWLEPSEYRLSKMAPVVEAARGIKRAEEAKDQGEWVKCHEILYRSLATMEAAHD